MEGRSAEAEEGERRRAVWWWAAAVGRTKEEGMRDACGWRGGGGREGVVRVSCGLSKVGSGHHRRTAECPCHASILV